MRLWRSGLVLALAALAGPIAAQQPPAPAKTYGPEYFLTAEAVEICSAMFRTNAIYTGNDGLRTELMIKASEELAREHDRRSPLSTAEDKAILDKRFEGVKFALSDGRLTYEKFIEVVKICNVEYHFDVFREIDYSRPKPTPAPLTPSELAECEAMPERGLAMLSQYKSNLERRTQGDQQLTANYCAAANDYVNEAVDKRCPIEVQRVLVRMSSEAQRLLDTANAGSSYKWACKTTY